MANSQIGARPRPAYRLPKEVRPSRYSLSFDINLDKFRYSCREVIDLEISKPVSQIILHAKDLNIKKAAVFSKNKLVPSKFALDRKTDRLVLKLQRGKINGNAKVIIELEGKIRDDLASFYRSKYKDKNGKERHWAITQFEPVYARMCIPCFDEPEFRASFKVTMKISKNLQAVSNMPEQRIRTEDGKKVVEFEETPKMPIYLLFLGVGQFDILEGNLGKTKIRILATPGKKNQCTYALDITKKALKYFEDYSGIPYPLPKLDMIAVPDFASGAMENWGAITFRELILLSDPKLTSTIIRKRIAEVIAHELWHQWSGNLVTMEWWNDLWLNESFATYMAYKALDHYFPEWKMMEDFTGDEMGVAFSLDSLNATHSIHVEVENPSQIGEIFDEISYNKGGCVLRMLESYLGAEVFRKGVSKYLSRFEYGNAEAADLWTSLSEVSNKPIKRIMEGWVRTAGYPLVESKLNGKMLSLGQKRFVFGKSDGSIWPIPLVIKTSDGKQIHDLFDTQKKVINLGSAPDWYLINHLRGGFYRASYGPENLSKLENLIFGRKLSVFDRWGIQDDLFESIVCGNETADRYLDLVKSYFNEDNYLVLSEINSCLIRFRSVYLHENFWPRIWPKYKEHFNEPYRKLLKRLGWVPKNGESHPETLLRELAIGHLIFVEDAAVIKKGKQLYEKYRRNIRSIHPNVKRSVLYVAASTGSRKTFDQMLKLYLTVESIEDKRLLLAMLARFRDPRIVTKVLEMSLTNKVKLQELPVVVGSAAGNPYARRTVFVWFKKNWRKLKKYEDDSSIFRNLLESVIASAFGRKEEAELKRFFATHPAPYKMVLRKGFEALARRNHWVEKNKEPIQEYFIS